MERGRTVKRKIVVIDWYDACSNENAFLKDAGEGLVHRVTFGVLVKKTDKVVILMNDYLRNFQDYGYITKIPAQNIILLRTIGTIGVDD